MRVRVSRIAFLCLVVATGCLAAQAIPQATAAQAQQFTVLRTGHFVAGAETPTGNDADCSVEGTGAGATMQCRRAGTAKGSYHFNTALVVDPNGAAYAIACRVPLVLVLCKKLEPGTTVEARIDGGVMAISDGDKVRRYQILKTAAVGPLPITQAPSSKSPAQVRSEVPAAAPASSSNRSPAKSQNQSAESPGDSSAPCTSPTGACVTFVSEPPGAEIYVDGKFMGDTPSMIILAAGSHELRIQAEKFAPWTRTFQASAGNKVTIRAPLQSQPPQN